MSVKPLHVTCVRKAENYFSLREYFTLCHADCILIYNLEATGYNFHILGLHLLLLHLTHYYFFMI